MSSHRRRHRSRSSGDLGFQIAPMIDVVFVILVFFMSLTSTVKIEAELNTRLPGTTVTSTAVEFPDEQNIGIEHNGQVLLNEDPFDNPDDPSLPRLTNALLRLKENADASKTLLLVTIASDPKAPYHRTVEVLNALAVAGVPNVTFTVSDGF